MPQTGATRYQKFLKSEKGKTKLKAKNKELPRGTNVTKTNFKVKKIVIKEQLKKHGETEALSTRKLNVSELLSRLNHFNTSSRIDALTGLKELITTHSGVLDQHLGQIINGITPLTLNIEKNVRRDSLQALHMMLSNVNSAKIDPFYEIMSTYLRSAMTHIDTRIQEDSLNFLDVLLICAPNKVAQDFHKIIPNFLDMISKLRVDSKPGRTLTVNLGSQITSVKWRVKVLHRLQDYLTKYTQWEQIDEENSHTESVKNYDSSKLNHYSLFNDNFISICHLSCFSSTKSQDSSPTDEIEKFLEYINTLMPLLFETWLEVCPNSSVDQNIETIVSEDGALLLKNSLKIIALLYKLVEHLNNKNPNSNIKKIFCQKYSSLYTQHFVKRFPYITNTRLKQKSDSPFENTITDSKLTAENLEICNLFILLNPNVNIKGFNHDKVSVLNYIERTFNQNGQDNINDIVIKILHTIFSSEINSWTKTINVMDALFRKIIWAYFIKDLSNTFKQKIFSLLCKIALNEKLVHFHQSDAFDTWLKNLPDILLNESVTIQTVDIIHKFAVRSNKTFNIVIKPKLTNIIQNLPNIKIVDAVNDTNSYHKLFSLLFWIKLWDTESLNLLEKQLMDGVYKGDHGMYIFDTLRLRTGGI